MLIACQARDDVVPAAPEVLALAQQVGKHGGAAAERRLREWSDQGSAVATRELGMLYRNDTAKRGEAMRLFEKAAREGDPESAFQLAEMYRTGNVSKEEATDKAWPWYVQAAEHRHAQAALTLASLARNGEGAPHSDAEVAKWLAAAGHVK
ncbi:tetratricopeptide repeat protein [Pseudoduganella sp. RAF53_2]